MNEIKSDEKNVSIRRRDVLKGVGAFAAVAATGFAQNTLAKSTEHSHIHTVDLAIQRIIDHAMDCVKKGDICTQHCMDLFKAGDTTLAACADSVLEMVVSCAAMSKLAAYNSKHLKAMVKVCISICEDCENECRKHGDKHAECKACADACAACIKSCKEYLA